MSRVPLLQGGVDNGSDGSEANGLVQGKGSGVEDFFVSVQVEKPAGFSLEAG